MASAYGAQSPAPGTSVDKAPAAQEKVQPKLDDEKKEKKDLLSSDPQLAAAVLLLRLQLAGAEL